MKHTDNKKNLITLFLVVLLDLIGFGMIIPLIPYLGKATGESEVMVGLLMAIYSVMQFLFSPFWGGISDKFGRKPVLLFSIFGAALSHTAFAFCTTYWMLFVTRLFAGLFSANISTAMAAASDLSTPEKRTQTMGLIGAAFGLGFVLGPFLGAQGASLGISFGFGDQFSSLIAGGLCFFNFFLCLFFFKESLKEKTKNLKINFKKLNPFLSLKGASKEIKNGVFLFFVATLALALIEVVLFFVVQRDYNWSYKEAAYGFAAIGLVMAFTQGGVIRPLKKRMSEIKIIKIGALLFSAGLLLAYTLIPFSLFSVSILILSFGYALLNPALSGYISLNAQKNAQGATFGITHGFSALSRIIGPVAGTLLAEKVALRTPFLFAGVLLLLALSFFIFLNSKEK